MSEKLLVIEIERIVNLTAGFGWKKVEEKISAGKVQIVLEKTIPVTVVPSP